MSSALTLICLPCAGASATMYLRWRRFLPAHIKLLALELPGRGALIDEKPLTHYAELVEWIVGQLALKPCERYALFGHSMGSLLAYGVCRQLAAKNKPLPLGLFVSASAAPARRDPDRFAGMYDDQSLIADLKRQGGTSDAVLGNAELLRMTLDVLAADYRVCNDFTYVDAASLDIPIHVFAGRDDEITEVQLRAWQLETQSSFSLNCFAGGHFYLREQEAALLSLLTRQLATLERADAAIA
ncbi:thioesterase II family protein [Deefgea rivuli]|uniref:thioesterase II family protein n=1 Tax=Deefgea rivuli TaxID=400948 RepID=UPI000488B18A|nr:alpha/beta fold hydrolase [Deefgea rivuli]